MIFYLITDIMFAVIITVLIFSMTKIPIKIQIKKTKLVTRIEKELSANFNYFRVKKKTVFEGYIEKIIKDSGIPMSLQGTYVLCFIFSILGGSIGYYLRFPFFILLLILSFFFIPIFVLFLIGSYRNIASYRSTFKVLHTAEKASQLSNSPLVIFRKIMPYLCERDRKHFERFLQNFDMNKPYYALFDELENSISNTFLKELIIYGRDTAKGIDYNKAINLILNGYNKYYELMNDRKKQINGLVYLLYILFAGFIFFSIYISTEYMTQLQATPIIQLFYKTTLLASIISVILASIALVNANQH